MQAGHRTGVTVKKTYDVAQLVGFVILGIREVSFFGWCQRHCGGFKYLLNSGIGLDIDTRF